MIRIIVLSVIAAACIAGLAVCVVVQQSALVQLHDANDKMTAGNKLQMRYYGGESSVGE